jgi:hypothetical protein
VDKEGKKMSRGIDHRAFRRNPHDRYFSWTKLAEGGWIAIIRGTMLPWGHEVLLGDSVFDNAAYVAGAPDVRSAGAPAAAARFKSDVGGVDESTTREVHQQLRRVPARTRRTWSSASAVTDALGSSDFLGAPARSIAEALSVSGPTIGDEFESRYAPC